MYMMARIYPTHNQAQAAADALLEAGYAAEDVAVLGKAAAAAAAAPAAEGEAEGAEVTAEPVAATSDNDSVATAIRVGSMLGRHSDFYMQKLEPGNSLLVATPPFIASRVAEDILDQHGPLPITHEPARKPFVPLSEQATPLSDFLGMPVLSRQAPIFSEALGLDTTSLGLTHLSRWFPPLADGWTFSGKIGMGSKAKSGTPLSSMLNLPLKSDRLAGKAASFGFGLKTKSDTILPFRTKAKRDRFLTQ